MDLLMKMIMLMVMILLLEKYFLLKIQLVMETKYIDCSTALRNNENQDILIIVMLIEIMKVIDFVK